MNASNTPGQPSVEALAELVTAVANAFPAADLQAGPADVQEDLDQLLPSDDSMVMVVPVTSGVMREVFVIVAPTLLTAMGGTDLSSLPELLGGTIGELSSGDEFDLEAARLHVGSDGLAGLAVGSDGPGSLMVAAGVFAGTDHMGTVGVSLQSGEVGSMDLPPVTPTTTQASRPAPARGLDILSGVEMNVVAELGRARMTVGDLLSLVPGSVIELDRSAGSPIDLLVNGTLIARGEVVVVDEEFGLRISEIVSNDEVTP